MSTQETERLLTVEEAEALAAGASTSTELVPIESNVEPVATPSALTAGLGKARDRHSKRARKGYGFWGKTPLGVRALKDQLHHQASTREASLAKYGEWAFTWIIALPITAFGLGLLRLIGLPTYRNKWEGTPPSLSQLYNATHDRGRLARGYGYGLILTHAVSYALMWIGQRPERLALAVPTLAAFIFADQLLEVLT